MKISIAEEAGFCFGVKRAMKMTERVAAQGFGESEKVYTFGPLVHNPQVISRLREKGVAGAEQMDDIHCGASIIRTHGVPPQHLEKLKQRAARIFKANEVRIFNTICDDTFVRPQSAAALAGQTAVMIGVGGRNSATTRKRVEICKSLQARTYHIEEVQEIVDIEFENAHRVGINTGASTPDWIIQDVVERLKHLPIHSAG